jgi:hypothetical protein
MNLIYFAWCLVGIWLLAAICLAERKERWRRMWRFCRPWCNTPVRSVALVGILAMLASTSVSLLVAWPEPRIHDEFSYLLAADTFAHGRLTNPSHPMAVHFETFHVNQEPTYCSIYPPGQGLVLALGQVIGHPLIGVWISFGVACAALCWMLQAYVPARWAVAGGLLAAIQLGFVGACCNVPGYWSQSYWGGAVAMTGGALIFGAWRRLVRRPRSRHAIVLAIGLAIVANSRPFEGAVVALPVAVAYFVWLLGRGVSAWKAALARVLLPMLLVLGLTASAMTYYNMRLTGNPLRLPYQQNGAKYGMTPLFLWQPLKPEPVYNHPVMRDYHTKWALPAYERMQTSSGYADELMARMGTLLHFYVGPVLLVPLLGLPLFTTKPWNRSSASCCGCLLLGLSLTTWLQPHYAAPITALIFLFIVEGLRHLRLWRPGGRHVGQTLVRTLPLVYTLLFAGAIGLRADTDAGAWHLQRARMLRHLQETRGRHLVIVRYGDQHSPHEEWVFNEADIDSAKVIWARDISHEANRVLIEYFKDHHVWLLEADARPARLIPY